MDTSIFSTSAVQYAKDADIEIIDYDEACCISSEIMFCMNPDNAGYWSADMINNTDRIIIGDRSGHDNDAEFCLWHELGHGYHKHGVGHHEHALTCELAANTWAFINYDGNDLQGFIQNRRRSILTYTSGGETTTLKTDELEATARTLGIYDLITWVEE